MTAAKIVFEAEPDYKLAKVIALKCKIFEIQKNNLNLISPKFMKILFAGKLLDDKRGIVEYSITPESTLWCIITKQQN